MPSSSYQHFGGGRAAYCSNRKGKFFSFTHDNTFAFLPEFHLFI